LIVLHWVGVGDIGGFRFDHRNISVTTQWTQDAFHALGSGKSGIEKRHPVDPSIANAQIARAQVYAIEREWFKRRLDAQSPYLGGKPVCGLSVY
jgi:hypothetical protein